MTLSSILCAFLSWVATEAELVGLNENSASAYSRVWSLSTGKYAWRWWYTIAGSLPAGISAKWKLRMIIDSVLAWCQAPRMSRFPKTAGVSPAILFPLTIPWGGISKWGFSIYPFTYCVSCGCFVLHLLVILLMTVWANKESILWTQDPWTSGKSNTLVHTGNARTISAAKYFPFIATRAAPLNKQLV